MSDEIAFGASGEIANDEGERLQKVLARVGWGSRRECEILIDDGRVKVNGEVAILGRRVKTQTDKVEVDDLIAHYVGHIVGFQIGRAHV